LSLGRSEAEVEVLQGAAVAEGGGFGAPGDGALAAHVEFVLEDEFKELAVGQPVGFGFLQAHFQSVQKPREAQGASVLFEDGMVHGGGCG
jgi:cold shock CspA family protein